MTKKVVIKSSMLNTNSKAMLQLARTLEYTSDSDMYKNEKAYMSFIGAEIEDNARFGMILSLNRKLQGFAVNDVVETASGTGASARDIYKIAPEVKVACVEWSQHLCEVGKKLNPHLTFINGDMCDWEQPADSVDVAFNSASSLGFLNIRQLHQHLRHMANMLRSGGSYYCDVGYYASMQVPYLNQAHIDKGHSSTGKPVVSFNATVQYFPATDVHHVVYSSWEKGPEQATLVEGFGHKLRSYRFSEMQYLAEMEGLQARIWHYRWDNKLKREVFIEMDSEFFVQDADDYAFLVEFYKEDAPRLDTLIGETASDIDKVLKEIK